MKRIFAVLVFAMFAVASFISGKEASAQPARPGHYETVQYAVPPVAVMIVCNVNGVDYPVDFNYRVWGVNGDGTWFVVGRIFATPAGSVAVANNRLRFSAACA